MIITFCGHSQIFEDEDYIESLVLKEIEKEACSMPIVFYLGGYGDFDSIAKRVALKYKQTHIGTILTFVTPYLDDKYLKRREPLKYGYDNIIYPDLEKFPRKYAIIERNKYMVKSADFVIVFVKYSLGGASKTFEYTKKLKKNYVNIADKL